MGFEETGGSAGRGCLSWDGGAKNNPVEKGMKVTRSRWGLGRKNPRAGEWLGFPSLKAHVQTFPGQG